MHSSSHFLMIGFWPGAQMTRDDLSSEQLAPKAEQVASRMARGVDKAMEAKVKIEMTVEYCIMASLFRVEAPRLLCVGERFDLSREELRA
jgi:hypothetical protein